MTLKAIAALSFLTHDIKNRVNELGPLSVMPFGTVVPGSRLLEDEVIQPEDLTIGTCSCHWPRCNKH